jgi:DNA-binding transcriptional LysR family regulator
VWTFKRGDEEVSIKPNGNIAISGSAVDAAVAGLGLAVASRLAFGRELENGQLIQLLPDWSLGEVEIHSLYPSGQAGKPAAKAFTDFLIRELRGL